MTLARRERALAGAAGALLCLLAWAIGSPNAVAVNFPSTAAPDRIGEAPHKDERRAVTIVRDPFVSDAGAGRRGMRAPADDEQFARIPGLPVLPPNGAIAGPSAKSSGGFVIHAVVTGERPLAIVTVGQETLFVRPGDTLLGKHIAVIDGAGILLEGNVRLPFAP